MTGAAQNLTKSQLLLLEIIKGLGGEVDDKTKLAKLEYLSDFIHYAFHDQPISDQSNLYQRRKQGPLSSSFNDDLMLLCARNYLKQTGEYSYKIAKKPVDASLSDEERKTVDFVISRYGGASWNDLVKIAHSQIPHLSAGGDGAVIEYFTAYNLVDDYPDYAEFSAR
jgi:hypothetical protein